MSDIPESREPAQYGNTTENDQYTKGDPDTRNGGGNPNAAANVDPSAEQADVECPRCEEEFKNLPLHLPSCDGSTSKE